MRVGSKGVGRRQYQIGFAGYGWAVSTKRDSYLSALFRRLAATGGNKRATMGVGHTILVIAYCLLKRKEPYVELGADYFEKKNPDALTRSLVRRLERLGNRVILEPTVQVA